jgi:DNA polymerase III epsilon subunit-like protein
MKPLLCFDIEGTGVYPAMDRIVQIANTKLVLREILDGLYVKQGGELF